MDLKNKLATATSVLIYGLPAVALAQAPEEIPDFNPEELQQATQDLEKATQTAARAGLFSTGVLGALAGFAVVGIILAIIWLVLWIWALVDVLGRTFKGNEKVIWLVLLIVALVIPFIPVINFLGIVTWLVPIIYLIVGRKRGTKGSSPATPGTPAK